jgi:hypothetical protein
MSPKRRRFSVIQPRSDLSSIEILLQTLGDARWFRGLCCIRKSSPDDVILTIERPCTCSFLTNPRSFASSQTGSLGHDVRHASITSS